MPRAQSETVWYIFCIMLKYLAILAIAAVVLPAAPPAPRGATGSPGQTSGNIQQKREGNHPASTPTIPVAKPDSAVPSDTDGHKQAPDNTEHRVTLTSLPPVTLTDKQKTFWDHVFDW